MLYLNKQKNKNSNSKTQTLESNSNSNTQTFFAQSDAKSIAKTPRFKWY